MVSPHQGTALASSVGSRSRREAAGFARNTLQTLVLTIRINPMRDPRTELDNLIAALQRHLEVASVADSEMDDSPVLSNAEEKLRDAFFTYDDALFTATGVELPFDILDEDDDDYDDDDNDDDDFVDDLDDEDDLIDDFDGDDDDDNDYLDEGDLENFDLHGED